MTRDETIALFLRGRDAWNAWGQKMLAERKGLEEEGVWLAEADWRGTLLPKNEKTRAWIEAASADFYGVGFETAAWPKLEPSAHPVPLDGARADFDGFIFPGSALFDRTVFAGDASFNGAVFSGGASFERAAFSGDAWFHGATFSGPARFYRAAFNGHAPFENAIFLGSASFDEALFRRAANFRGADARQSFSLAGAYFQRRVPDLTSAKFAKPVLLDKLRLAPGMEPGLFVRSVFGGALLWMVGQADATLSARYRALKQFAREQHDRSKEHLYFRGELRSRRYAEDKPWHPAFWLGILYELVSGFGHSLFRPILWLAALTLVSGWFYLDRYASKRPVSAHLQARIFYHLPAPIRAALPAPPLKALRALPCKQGKGDPVKAAALLAVRQSLAIGAFDTTQSAPVYACLYGFDETLVAPVVPGAVGLWSAVQTALAAALWFLFLLALRNQFSIE